MQTPTHVQIRHRPTPAELSTDQLIQRIKAEHAAAPTTDTWSRFVQLRDLKPEIDAKTFYRLYHRLPADRHETSEVVPFRPTHHDTITGLLYQFTLDPSGLFARLVAENGMTGSEPTPAGTLPARFRALQHITAAA